jgi:hypothetical protein
MAPKVYTTEAKLRGTVTINRLRFKDGKVLASAYHTPGPKGQTWIEFTIVLRSKSGVPFRIVIDEKAEELLSDLGCDLIERTICKGLRHRKVK